MSEKANHFKIGMFVLVGVGLFVAALFALGLGNFFVKGGDLFETYVPGGVENLAVGAPVKLRGVNIGKVTVISFIGKEHPEYREQAVRIVFEVPHESGVIAAADNVQQMFDTEVAHGLRARVEGQGLFGPSLLSLEYVNPKFYPVTPVAWKPKYYYIPSAPSQFEHVFAALENTLSRTEDLDLAALLGRAQNLIETANHLLEHVNEIDFKHLGTNAGAFIVELRETNRGLQRTLADAQDAIKGADLPTISRNAQALETRLSNAAIELRRMLASVDTGELNSSLANIRAATEELTILLHTLEQRPSSVLFSKPPRPAGSMEVPPKK